MKSTRGSAKEENVQSRLRLGHTRLNKTLHLTGKHPMSLCNYCQVEESVEHVLSQCQKYINERKIFRNSQQETIKAKQILSQTDINNY